MGRLRNRTAALFAALLLLLPAALALGLEAEPAAGSRIEPGDTIAYTYTLPGAMEGCVLRVSLPAGNSVREGSVQVKSSRSAQVIYGSDGFVVMADRLDAGDMIVFVTEVGSAALEVWARIAAADGSISEEAGYASHALALAAPAGTPAPAASSQGIQPEDGAQGRSQPWIPIAILGILLLAALGWILYKRRPAWRQTQDEGSSAAVSAPGEMLPEEGERDNTVEYLDIPENE